MLSNASKGSTTLVGGVANQQLFTAQAGMRPVQGLQAVNYSGQVGSVGTALGASMGAKRTIPQNSSGSVRAPQMTASAPKSFAGLGGSFSMASSFAPTSGKGRAQGLFMSASSGFGSGVNRYASGIQSSGNMAMKMDAAGTNQLKTQFSVASRQFGTGSSFTGQLGQGPATQMRASQVRMSATQAATGTTVAGSTGTRSFTVNGATGPSVVDNFLDLEFRKGAEQMMGAANDLKKMSEYPIILTDGGDDRLPLDPGSGTNKYHQKPFVASDALFRGSCTCNSPTQLAYDTAKKYYDLLKEGKTDVEAIMHEVRQKIAQLYQLPEGTGIFLTPSGSDAEYIPLLMAKLFNEGKQVSNIVTCNEEVGSGTLDAAGGRFFSALEPIPGYATHIEGGPKMSDPVLGLGDGVETIAIAARAPSGEVVNSYPEVQDALNTCEVSYRVPVVHQVYGSKTGICQPFEAAIKEEAESMGGLYVVDACQGRFEIDWLNEQLNQGTIVLITGSKFFRGPPFSGGVLVPAPLMAKLEAAQEKSKVPSGLNTFIGKAELPRELQSWRDQVEDNQNPGLALRWVAALAEMEPTLSIPKEVREKATDAWRQSVIKMVKAHAELDYFAAAEDTASIVSLRIRHPDTGKWMDKSQLAKVFKAMTLDMSDKFPDDKDLASKICFTGQPVLISKEEAVLRIALGSDSLRQVIDDMDKGESVAHDEDDLICQKMAFLARNFGKL